jgi:uncharacterized protein involved in exopolysaccharide biosynthesis
VYEFEFGKLNEDINFTVQVNLSEKLDETWLRTVQEQNFQVLVHNPDWLVSKYKGNLAIENMEYTSILGLTLRDELPNRAKMFLDTLAKEYIDFTLQNEITINKNTERFIDRQLDEITGILDSLEGVLNAYKESQQILDLDREQRAAFDQLTSSEVQLEQLKLRKEAISGLEEYLYKEEKNTVLPPLSYLDGEDKVIQDFVMQLFQARIKRSELLVDYKDADRRIMRVDSTIKNIKNNIFKYVRDTKGALEGKIVDLQRVVVELEYRLRSLPKSQREILGIERKLVVNEGLYTFFLEKKANTVIARAAIIPQTSIIETARSLGVVGPDKKSATYLAIGIALLLAFLIGLIRMVFFERIENKHTPQTSVEATNKQSQVVFISEVTL